MRILKIIAYLIFTGCFSLKCFATEFELTSTQFQANRTIPQQYTCQGRNISPNLQWKHAPKHTQSFALIMSDPDAPNGNWVHWIVFNLPSNTTHLSPNVDLPIEAVNGLNSWNKPGYSGPCPPKGTHRYIFRLYALDTVLQLSDSAKYDALLDAMRTHIIGQAVLVGMYNKVQ